MIQSFKFTLAFSSMDAPGGETGGETNFADLPSVSRSDGTCVVGVGPDKIISAGHFLLNRSLFVLYARL
jgi:hypothetical protein